MFAISYCWQCWLLCDSLCRIIQNWFVYISIYIFLYQGASYSQQLNTLQRESEVYFVVVVVVKQKITLGISKYIESIASYFIQCYVNVNLWSVEFAILPSNATFHLKIAHSINRSSVVVQFLAHLFIGCRCRLSFTLDRFATVSDHINS